MKSFGAAASWKDTILEGPIAIRQSRKHRRAVIVAPSYTEWDREQALVE
jgi:hypothetical protein